MRRIVGEEPPQEPEAILHEDMRAPGSEAHAARVGRLANESRTSAEREPADVPPVRPPPSRHSCSNERTRPSPPPSRRSERWRPARSSFRPTSEYESGSYTRTSPQPNRKSLPAQLSVRSLLCLAVHEILFPETNQRQPNSGSPLLNPALRAYALISRVIGTFRTNFSHENQPASCVVAVTILFKMPV